MKQIKGRFVAAAIALSMGLVPFLGTGIHAEGETSENREKVNDLMYKEGLPIVDPGSYSFSLFVDWDNSDAFMLKQFEEETGIHVDLQAVPYNVATEKLNISLNSGDYADCIGGWIMSETAILTQGVEEGVFIPLEDLFKSYCPRIEEVLNLPTVRQTMTAPDGHIYSVPYVIGVPDVPFNPYINTRWLKNVGMEMPTTTEELREVLRAFKEKDANGNGDPNDEIPFAADPNNKNLGLLCGWFGASVRDNGFTMVGDKRVFAADSDAYRKGIEYLHSLYAEGLMDPELFTKDLAQWKSAGGNDRYGVCMMYGSGDIMPFEDGQEPEWRALPVLKGEGVDKPVYLRDAYDVQILKNQVVVTDKAKNPEAIARWWDYVYQLDNSLQTQNGPLGVTLIKDDQGNYSTIDRNTLSKEDQDRYSWGNLWPQSLPKYVPADLKIKSALPKFEEKDLVDELYAPYLTEAFPKFWVSLEDGPRMSDLSTAITDYVKGKQAEWISGQSDINADWDSYKEQLDRLGLKELLEIQERALAAQAEAVKKAE